MSFFNGAKFCAKVFSQLHTDEVYELLNVVITTTAKETTTNIATTTAHTTGETTTADQTTTVEATSTSLEPSSNIKTTTSIETIEMTTTNEATTTVEPTTHITTTTQGTRTTLPQTTTTTETTTNLTTTVEATTTYVDATTTAFDATTEPETTATTTTTSVDSTTAEETTTTSQELATTTSESGELAVHCCCRCCYDVTSSCTVCGDESLSEAVQCATHRPPSPTPFTRPTQPNFEPPAQLQGSKFDERLAYNEEFLAKEQLTEIMASMPLSDKVALGVSATEFILDCSYDGIPCSFDV